VLTFEIISVVLTLPAETD